MAKLIKYDMKAREAMLNGVRTFPDGHQRWRHRGQRNRTG
jgi:hypothetical protein